MKIAINSKAILFLFLAGLILLNGCKEEEIYPRTRLFQPVLNEDLYSVDNTIIVNMGKMTDAISYKIEVSRDSFATVLYTVETDTNFVILNAETVGEELLWFTIYQVQATAYADEDKYNSLPSFLGSVRTQKYPSNMGAPTFFDILDTRARVFWTEAGAPINGVKVFAITDERLENPLLEFTLTQADTDSLEYIVSGLEPSTTYQIAIYSDGVLRGWEIYTTRPPLVSGDNVVDLTGIDSMDISLAYRLADVADGSIVILEGGKTYWAKGYAFDKSIDFISGYSFVPALPYIDCSTNFNFKDGSTVDHVTFKDIKLSASDGGFAGRYVFNVDMSATVGEIKFESCQIRLLRGIARLKAGTGSLDKFTITDCVIDSIKDYGILSVDVNTWICNDILVENTTISRAVTVFTSRNNSNTVTLDGCTIQEAPEYNRPIFRWREVGQDNVLNGITISNTIWGHGWDLTLLGVYVDGYDGLASTNWNILNTYTSSEFGWATGKEAIPGFPNFVYTGLVTDLWEDPVNADFTFKDQGFSGKSDCGDPRWRVGLK